MTNLTPLCITANIADMLPYRVISFQRRSFRSFRGILYRDLLKNNFLLRSKRHSLTTWGGKLLTPYIEHLLDNRGKDSCFNGKRAMLHLFSNCLNKLVERSGLLVIAHHEQSSMLPESFPPFRNSMVVIKVRNKGAKTYQRKFFLFLGQIITIINNLCRGKCRRRKDTTLLTNVFCESFGPYVRLIMQASLHESISMS